MVSILFYLNHFVTNDSLAQCAILTFDRKPWCGYVMNVISGHTVEDASFVALQVCGFALPEECY